MGSFTFNGVSSTTHGLRVTSDYIISSTGSDVNGTANDNFFSPENMRRLLRELAYYTNLEGGRMA